MTENTTIFQERKIGQRSAIRRLNFKDMEDVARLRKILDSQPVQDWMEDVRGLTTDDLEKWATGTTDNEYLYVVSGSQGVNPSEVGEVQGFINIYKSADYPGAYEVSYAKNPAAASGQIASALRQALVDFNIRFSGRSSYELAPSIRVVSDPSIKRGDQIEHNEPSAKVTEAAGFVKKGAVWELDWKKLNEKLIKSSYQFWKPTIR